VFACLGGGTRLRADGKSTSTKASSRQFLRSNRSNGCREQGGKFFIWCPYLISIKTYVLLWHEIYMRCFGFEQMSLGSQLMSYLTTTRDYFSRFNLVLLSFIWLILYIKDVFYSLLNVKCTSYIIHLNAVV
jgi:hypothetical protein